MLSPFSSHLATNYSASELEKAQIQQLLKGPIEDNQRIDCEIEELRQQLEALVHKREENDHFIEPHLALLAPIRGLPNEILCAIFSHCLPTPARFLEDPFDSQEYMSAAQAPMLLTFICQRWRQIALDLPELWQRAPITVSRSLHSPTDLDLGVQNASQLTQLWLSRARNRPVAISISWELYPTARTQFDKFLASITRYSSQWEELRINSLLDRGLLDGILSLPSSSVPNLRNLEVPFEALWGSYDKKCLLGGPSIRGFRYKGAIYDHFAKLPLQWSQLTDLHLGSLNTTDTNIRKIFARCPQLERCHISISTVEIFESYPLPRLRLSYLVLLHLRMHPSHSGRTLDPPIGFFASLNLPSLKDLTMNIPNLRDFPPAVVVGKTLATLRRLTVFTDHSSTATDAMLETLALTTRLESLELYYLPELHYLPHLISTVTYSPLSDTTFLAALTPRQEENPSASRNASSGCEPQHARFMERSNYPSYLCPNLQDIKLQIAAHPGIANEVIFDFIKGRRERSTTLRSFSLQYARPVDDGEREMQGVNDLGVNVDIKYQGRGVM
ncbi:hypothetical protein DFP72DRAFT_1083115 [Ephemerocybe angulata]|uniref:F-box domain-containing protein n=1 Tax=Ephemerocybe angulata TaxID=980116 RepID=A0A8H6H946_9AGAR|nr:hypothetical protein DFP72DRAFT_1083115 [Tulosesus angulatus]